MILAVIPARGGSKGLPRKNLRLLGGKALLAWTIEAALRSKRIDRTVVSTEDPEIAQVARTFGAEILDRPKTLASDEASLLGVLQHAVRAVPASAVVLLQPTCPVRNEGLIDDCIRRFQEAGADSLATGFICHYMEYAKDSEDLQRQQIPGFFYDNGSVYVIRADLIEKGDRYGTRIERVLLDKEQSIDIDDEFDFWLAEQILLQRRGITQP